MAPVSMPHPSIVLLRAGALVALAFSAALAVEYYLPGDTFCGPEGGCAAVRTSDIGRLIATYLPGLGVLAYTAVFATSLFRGRDTARYAAIMSIAGGAMGATFLILQGVVIGRFCELCVGVDIAAIVAAAAGIWVVYAKPGIDDGKGSLASPAWSLFAIALFAPMAFGFTVQDPDVPDEIRELFREDADVNIVEMADFECPFCRALHPVLRSVVEESEHDVHLARIIVPLPFHPHARDAAAAYFCAEDQGFGEPMADRLFAADDLSPEGALREARQIEGHLDIPTFEACVAAEETQTRIDADDERARDAGMNGLPTVYVGERILLGFGAENGATPYIEAVEAAARGEGSRIRIWPLAIVVLLALGLALLMWPRAKPKPAASDDDDDDEDDNDDEPDES